MYFNIKSSINWKSITPINEGFSSDSKYLVITNDNEKLLLRLSNLNKYEEKKKEFEIINKYSKIGFNMSKPIELGKTDEYVYMVLSYIEGENLNDILSSFSINKQYELGRKAGKILRSIHILPIDENDIPTQSKKDKKLKQLLDYENSNVRIDNDQYIIDFIRNNIDIIDKAPLVYQHGDFHPSNLIYQKDGTIGVIDFNRWEVSSAYEEFVRLQSFTRQISIPYCIGQIDSYFNDEIPELFWKCFKVYVAHTSLVSISWAIAFGQNEIDGMIKRCQLAINDYDNFKLDIPKWYKKR